jgi:hypothetical protein
MVSRRRPTGERNQSYDDFLEDLQKGGKEECRYGLFDFEYTHQCQGTSEVNISFDFLKIFASMTSGMMMMICFLICVGIEKTKIILNVVVSRYCHRQKKDCVLFQL